ncbi:hypothetical protein ABZZ79_12530 [Streptomyces sp. NPDC006458]|uniref:hypothetical protein n=1 Tax=Streptomyces sp. NPDC006458 TaxID=3154302 RepID=UPI0033B14158
MIEQVAHQVSDTGPAGLALALEGAYALHAPTGGRAPEVPSPTAGSRRRAAGRRRTARNVRG